MDIPKLPKLYKYRYFNETLVARNGLPQGEQIPQWQQVLFDGLLFPAHPDSFNDPYDCEFLLEDSFVYSNSMRHIYVQELSKRYSISNADKESILNAVNPEKAVNDILWRLYRVKVKNLSERMMTDLNSVMHEVKSLLRVLCLSEINDSILMWSHYAQNHQGFCIEYDLNAWDCKRHLKPVQYFNDRHKILGNFADFPSPNVGNAIFEAALYKADIWSYEREWRLIMNRLDLVRPDLKGLTPVCALKDHITAIYLGAKAKKEYEVQVCTHFKNTPVKVYRMKMISDRYALQAEQIQ